MTIPFRDGDITTELSEHALLLALVVVLTPEDVKTWLDLALKLEAAMLAGKRPGFDHSRVIRPDSNGRVGP